MFKITYMFNGNKVSVYCFNSADDCRSQLKEEGLYMMNPVSGMTATDYNGLFAKIVKY